MKLKKFGFSAIAIIFLLSVPPIAFGGSGDYLVPVTLKKANGKLKEGYIVLQEGEILCMGSWASSSRPKGNHPSAPWKSQRVIWAPEKGRKDIPSLLEFDEIIFREGGYEVFITYGKGEKPQHGNNFFSERRVRFTTDPSHPDILPLLLGPGEVLWIKRTGKPRKIR